MTLTHGSLCTGYDGIGMGLRLASLPIEDAWCAEVEPSVAALLTAPNLGDIKAVGWTRVAPVEVLSSGDPCQSISVAGRQLGKEDPRFLWPWVRDAIEALRPRAVFLENVQGMVSHDQGRTMAERFTDLQALGYRIRWTVIGACAIGAPHHRHRWYAYAERSTASTPAVERIGTKAHCGAPRSGGRHLLPTPNAREGGERGLPSRAHAQRRADNPERSLNLEDAVALLPTPCVAGVDWGKFADAVALWEEITGVVAPAPTVPGPNGGVRLNPQLPEWMMGLPIGHLSARMSRNDALKAAGNGVVPLQAAAAWRMLAD